MAGNQNSGRRKADKVLRLPGAQNCPAAPRWIGKAARAEYQRLARELYKAGILTIRTKPAVLAMACTFAQLRACHMAQTASSELDKGATDRFLMLSRELRQWLRVLQLMPGDAGPAESDQPDLPGFDAGRFLAAKPA